MNRIQKLRFENQHPEIEKWLPRQESRDPCQVPRDPRQVPRDPYQVSRDPHQLPRDPRQVPRDPRQVPRDPHQLPREPDSQSEDGTQREGWDDRPEGWEDINYDYVHDVLHLPNPTPPTATVPDLTAPPRDVRTSTVDHYEAIFVLAGGLNEENRNHQWVVRRLDLAVKFWAEGVRGSTGREGSTSTPQILCLGGGTYHKPSPRNHQGFVMHESTVCAQYLISRGIPHKQIMREWASYDTIANAWFALTNYTIPFNYRKIALITSDFHMPRAREIFLWLWNLAGRDAGSELSFHSVDSDGLDPDVIEARKKREAQSLKTLTATINKIRDLRSFASWFYHEHRAYNCEVVGQRCDDTDCRLHSIDQITKQSY